MNLNKIIKFYKFTKNVVNVGLLMHLLSSIISKMETSSINKQSSRIRPVLIPEQLIFRDAH